MDLDLTNRTALVLGASGGLGAAIARALAREGAAVALAGRDEGALERTRASLPGETRAATLTWDLADPTLIEPSVACVEDTLGAIDILVNNGGGPPPGPVVGQLRATWERWYAEMVLPIFGVTDWALPGMKERGWGRIVTSTSSGVVAPIPNLGLSNTLRAALLGWSKTLAAEVGAFGITSNVVLPGRITTDRIAFLDACKAEREERDVAAVAAESLRAIPVGRYGDPEEYGDVMAFLASARASYVNGSVIRVDGGYIPSI